MGIIQFDIRHPNGQRESAVIEGERALIGSAAHCDVRLPMDQAAYEHVLVEVIGATLRAESKSENPPATINGMPLTASALGPDSVLGIGRIRVFVTFAPDLLDGANFGSGSTRRKESNPAVQLGLVAVFGVAAYVLLAEDELQIAPPPAQAPALFTEVAAKCPQANPTQAVAYAHEQMTLAHGKRERMPFYVTDGVAAVGLYQVAAACFRLGTFESGWTEADDAANTLKRDLTDDFRARRLRLTHMLKVQDYEMAKQDIAVLRALTDGKTGSYVEWLATVAKQLKGKGKK